MSAVAHDWEIIYDKCTHAHVVIKYRNAHHKFSLNTEVWLSNITRIVVKNKHIIIWYRVKMRRDAVSPMEWFDMSTTMRRYRDARDDELIAMLKSTML